MRAVIVSEFGPVDSHRLGELPETPPQAGEVVVAIQATAVNFVDLLVVTGQYQFLPERPFSPGKLPAGIVSAVGPDVTGLKIGDRVLTLAEQGGYAQKVNVPAAQCFKLPASMSFVDAAAMALVYDTSWFALRERGRLNPGESVLVLGGSGGIGLASIQLAKAMGARVLAGISTSGKMDLVRDPGADAVIDLSEPDLRNSLRDQSTPERRQRRRYRHRSDRWRRVDAALRAVAWRGRVVVVGFASGRIPRSRRISAAQEHRRSGVRSATTVSARLI